jgi:hypothetical protein
LDAAHTTLPFSGQLWPAIEKNRFKLTVNMRLRSAGLTIHDKADMMEFSRFLLSIGNGLAPTIDGYVRLPDAIVMPYEGCASMQQLVHKIYGELTDPHGYRVLSMAQKQQFFAERALLAPKNADIKRLNDDILKMLPGERVV